MNADKIAKVKALIAQLELQHARTCGNTKRKNLAEMIEMNKTTLARLLAE